MKHLKCSLQFACIAYCAWLWVFVSMIASSVSLLSVFSHSRLSNWGQMRQLWRNSSSLRVILICQRGNDWRISLCRRWQIFKFSPWLQCFDNEENKIAEHRKSVVCCFSLDNDFVSAGTYALKNTSLCDHITVQKKKINRYLKKKNNLWLMSQECKYRRVSVLWK